MLKPTILSLSLLTVMSGSAIAPALAKITVAFPDVSPTSIKLILTLPAIFIIIAALMMGKFSSRIPKRRLLTIGLILYSVGGIGAGYVNNFYLLLAGRAVMGIGVGIIMPLSTGLISDFFDGAERVKLIGYSTATTSMGGVIGTLAAGSLAALSWRYTFNVYALGIVVLILVLAFLPEPSQPRQIGVEASSKLPREVYKWALGAMTLMLAFYAVPINLAIFLERNSLGGAAEVGIAMSVMTACGFIAGLTFSRVRELTKEVLPFLLYILMGVGYLLLSKATSFHQAIFATAFIGLSMGWGLPTLFNGATQAAGKGKGVQAMAIVSSLGFLGQFMSPVILDVIGNMLGDSTARFSFTVISTLSVVGLLVTVAYRIAINQKTNKYRTSKSSEG
jgi:MFS family permease